MADHSFETIMQRCLARVPGNVDKRGGSIIYDALAPAVAELAQLYIEIGTILDRAFADTATGTDLSKKALERSVQRRAATHAIRKAVFANGSGAPMDVPLGGRYSGGEVNYRTIERMALGQYQVEAETAGEIGNSYFGNLLPITFVAGLGKATLEDILIPGQDEESDASLRERYFDSLEIQAFGGNVKDYKDKTESLPGVGAAKIEPTWQGGGTVKIVIIAANWDVPSDELVESVQETIDPHQDGDGYGLAPIGHVVTVEGTEGVTVDISFALELAEDVTWESIRAAVEDAYAVYLLSLRQSWADSDHLVVRIAQCETAILAIPGVIDITGTALNGATDNLQLTAYQIPLKGSVTNETTG